MTMPLAVDDAAVRACRDFMAIGYQSLREPLSLGPDALRWLADIYFDHRRRGGRGGDALVLGATPFMAELLRSDHDRVVLVDKSAPMLQHAESTLPARNAPDRVGRVEMVQSLWAEMSGIGRTFDVVAGDNSFSYLAFPDEWAALCEQLASMMTPGALLFTRCLSVPHGHARLSSAAMVERFLARDRINYTEVRTTLLFAQWEPVAFSIATERALDEFTAYRACYERLLAKWPPDSDNDLLTIHKYKGAGAIYYAPPLDRALAVFAKHFRVSAVHFGNYALSEHFPLIVATRR